MRFSIASVISFFVLIAISMAYSFSSYSVFLNAEEKFTVTEASDEVHRVFLESLRDILAFAVKVEGSSKPHQLLFLLSNGEGLDHAVIPTFDAKSRIASTKIPMNKIPNSLKAQERIFVSVVAADSSEEEQNAVQPIVELVPSDDFKAAFTYEEPARLGAKPEIHHIFNSEQATVNPIIPVAFSVVAVALLFVLFRTWANTLGTSLFGALEGSSFKTGLLVVLASFELTFIKYYLGTTIFTTLFHVAILSVPALIVGSKALSQLAKLRTTIVSAKK